MECHLTLAPSVLYQTSHTLIFDPLVRRVVLGHDILANEGPRHKQALKRRMGRNQRQIEVTNTVTLARVTRCEFINTVHMCDVHICMRCTEYMRCTVLYTILYGQRSSPGRATRSHRGHIGLASIPKGHHHGHAHPILATVSNDTTMQRSIAPGSMQSTAPIGGEVLR